MNWDSYIVGALVLGACIVILVVADMILEWVGGSRD